jgi:hypothetical protein
VVLPSSKPVELHGTDDNKRRVVENGDGNKPSSSLDIPDLVRWILGVNNTLWIDQVDAKVYFHLPPQRVPLRYAELDLVGMNGSLELKHKGLHQILGFKQRWLGRPVGKHDTVAAKLGIFGKIVAEIAAIAPTLALERDFKKPLFG